MCKNSWRSEDSWLKLNITRFVIRSLIYTHVHTCTLSLFTHKHIVIQFATASFTGKVQALLDLFENLASKLKASLPSSNNSKNYVMALPALPLISSLALRLQLLHPENHNKLAKFEHGAELTTSDTRLMHIEALRRLSLANWPHNDYL